MRLGEKEGTVTRAAPPLTSRSLHADLFTIAGAYMGVTALPSYKEDSPAPIIAAWRVVATALGVLLNMLSTSLIFPISVLRFGCAHQLTPGACHCVSTRPVTLQERF